MSIERVAIVQRDVNLLGSLERDAFLLARELVELGLDVHVYCAPETRAPLDGATFHDVRPALRSDSRAGRAILVGSFAAAATRAVRRDQAVRPYDVVDVNGVAGWEHDVVRLHEVVHAAQRRYPREFRSSGRLMTARAFAAPLLRPELAVRRAIQRLQFRPGAYTGVVAVSEDVARDGVERFGIPPGRIAVVPPAADVRPATPGVGRLVRARLGVSEEAPLLLFVGHAFSRKGLPQAIEALAGLPPATSLAVVGDGNGERPAAELLAARAGVADRVHFVGADDPCDYYDAADLLVLPTAHEPWGIPVVEAMASGLPVVTTSAAGSAGEVERADAGLVLDPERRDQLQDALAALIADGGRRQGMGERGRRAAEGFTARARAEATLAAYEQFGQAGPPRTARRTPRPAGTTTIASFPAVQAMNPYQRLLYDHLRPHGFELEPDATLSLGWLLAARGRVDVLHVHWTDGLYRFGRGPAALRPAGSWAKLGLFGLRLALARRLGYRIAWTIHQVYPHESSGRGLDRDGGAAARPGGARPARPRRDVARARRGGARTGSRRPARRSSRTARTSASTRPAGRARSCAASSGSPRAPSSSSASASSASHKSWRLVVRAFRACARPDVALVLVGPARARPVREMIAAETEGDERIHVLLRYVEEEAVAELFGAADAAIVARDDGGTSGSLVLPLSLGVPVVAADRPAYRELTGGETAAWLFAPGDERALTDALERAASDRADARGRGDAALELARRRAGTTSPRRTARLLREAPA